MLVLVRWVHFASVIVLFGASFFWIVVAPRRTRPCDELSWTASRTILMLRTAAPLAVVSGIGWLAATIVNVAGGIDGLGDPQMLRAFFLETDFGPVEIGRLVVLLLALATSILPMRAAVRFRCLAVLAAALLVSQAWLGHAAEGGASFLGLMMIAAYALHMLAVGAWLGGLPPLLLAVKAMSRRVEEPHTALRLLSRFSVMATSAVIIIVSSGTANTAFHVRGDLAPLVRTVYGAVLLGKLGLVSFMLLLAAYNRFYAMPHLAVPDPEVSPRANVFGRLAVSIGCELALGVCVLAAAAVLGISPPPQ